MPIIHFETRPGYKWVTRVVREDRSSLLLLSCISANVSEWMQRCFRLLFRRIPPIYIPVPIQGDCEANAGSSLSYFGSAFNQTFSSSDKLHAPRMPLTGPLLLFGSSGWRDDVQHGPPRLPAVR